MLETQRNTSYVYLSSRVVGEPRCSAETIQGVAWSTTAQGGTDIQPCPSGARGKPSVHSMGHLQVLISLYFKASLHAKSLLWISVFVQIEIGTNYHNTTISHSDSPWKRGWGELGNGLLSWVFLGILHVECFHESSWLYVVSRASSNIHLCVFYVSQSQPNWRKFLLIIRS